MNVADLYARCVDQGILITVVDNDRLKVSSKHAKVPLELKKLLQANKESLLEMLKATDDSECPLTKVDRNSLIPLSFAQQRLWFLWKLEGDSAHYNIPLVLRLSGELDRQALIDTLRALVVRHEPLRTRFVETDGQVHQVIDGAEKFQVSVETLDVESNLHSICTDEVSRGFDLSKDSLFRARLLIESETEHVLLVTMHHSVSDGWSVQVFRRELLSLYEAFSKGRGSPLPNLPIQYADFAYWQRQWLVDKELETQLSYWEDRLDGIDGQLSLPTDRPRPPVKTYHGARLPLSCSSDLLRGLQELSDSQGATLYMTLLSAFMLLLSRYSGEEDITVGSPIANRNRPEIEGLIGFFVNTLVMRADVEGDKRFTELLAEVKEAALSAYSHQDVPFEMVVERLQPERSMSHSPLFQVMFALQEAPGSGQGRLGDLAVSPVQFDFAITKFDLTLEVRETASGLRGNVEYNTDLFEQGTIERFVGHYERLLELLVEAPESAVGSYDFLSEAERHQQLVEWNDTAGEYPKDKCIHELFEEQVERYPGNTAVVFEEQQLTYLELNERSNQVAHYLRGQGVKPDTLVGLCVERSLEMVVGLLGILKAGGAYVPIDPAYPQERIGYMLEDSGVELILSQSILSDQLPITDQKLLYLDTGQDSAGNEGVLSSQPTINLPKDTLTLTPQHLAYVIYTSGSTGRPKGVMVEHGNVARLFYATEQDFGFTQNDVWTLFHSFAFDFSVWELWGAFVYGGRLVVVPQSVAHSPADYYQLLVDEQVTVLNQTPSAFGGLIEIDGVKQAALSLRVVVFGGEALSLQMLKPWVDRHGDEAIQLVNMYGITETTVHVTYRRLYKEDIEDDKGSVIGRKLGDLRLYLLDEGLSLVPSGVSGEIFVGGGGVSRGYLHNAELTGTRFIEDPFVAGELLYRTGDLGCYDDSGELRYLGRIDDQVKVRGFRIELGEIESQLSQHQWVDRCVVLAREGDGGDKQLVAYVVPDSNLVKKEDLPPDFQQSLRDHLQGMLPEYMVPSAYVVLDEIPLTPNGKVDKKALPAPDSGAYGQEEYVAPRTETERVLVGIWSELLGFEADELSVRSNFFALGGHSLLVVKLIAQLQQAGLQVAVRSVFDAPTIEALASAIDGSSAIESYAVPPNKIPVDCEQITPEMLPLIELSSEEIETIVATVPGGAANVQDIYPLAPLQEGILFHHLINPDNDPYITTTLLSIDSRAQVDTFLAELRWVTDRHDVLRTAVLSSNLSQPVQVVYRQVEIAVEELNLAPDRDTKEQLQEIIAGSQSMELSVAPLLRVKLAQDQQSDRWFLLLNIHHLVDDASSIQILFDEISMHLQGCAEQLPQVVPYRDFIGHALHQSEITDAEGFFRERLGDVDEPTLPFGLADVRGDGSEIEEGLLQLDDGLCQSIRSQAKALQVSPAVLFHAAWGLVIGACSGRDDVVFGTVLSGRLQGTQGAERMLGMFINTLPLRITLSGKSVLELVRETELGLKELLSYEQVSLSVAQRCSGLDGDVPLFGGLLNYRHSAARKEKRNGNLADSGRRILGVRERTNYPLMLAVDESEEMFSLSAQVDNSVSVERVLGYLECAIRELVEALEAGVGIPVSQVGVLSEAERHQQLVEWNDTAGEYPKDKCIHELFEEQVERYPGNTAVVFEEQQLTYLELNERSNQVAHYLRGQGVKPDTLVGLCVERSLEMVVGLLGILKAGGAYVPIDPAYPQERIRYMLEDSGVELILSQSILSDQLPITDQKLLYLDTGQDSAGNEEVLSSQPTINLPKDTLTLTPQHLAYVIYTSGSTGRPKGVMIEHTGIVRLVSNPNFISLNEDLIMLQQTTLSFDVSAFELWAPLLNGGKLVVYGGDSNDVETLLGTVLKSNVNTIALTPSLLQLWIGQHKDPVPCVSTLVVAGEALKVSSVVEAYELNPHMSIIDAYGPTENSVYSVAYTTANSILPDDVKPIGRPVSQSTAYVLDSSLNMLPMGAIGELIVGGAGLARGYLNNEKLTKEKFIPNPFSDDPDDRLYRTGDLARWLPDGNLEFLGRIDDQVKVRGFRIELGEIESQLSQHQWVDRCVVVAREGDGGDKQLVAYVVPDSNLVKKEDLPPDFQQSLRDHLQGMLPEYMVPSAYVVLDEIPLTPNGKVDKKALPAPDSGAYGQEEYVAPRTETERVLVGIWSELLGFEADELSVRSNFFALGGHSLLVVKLIAQLQQAGLQVAVRSVFDSPTVEALASAIDGSSAIESYAVPPNKIPVDCEQITPEMLPLIDLTQTELDQIASTVPGGYSAIQDIYPLAPLQEGILFHHLLDPDNDPYVLSMLSSFESREQLDRYVEGLQWVINRHDVLRTSVVTEGLSQPAQVVWREATLRLEELTTNSEQDIEEQMYTLWQAPQSMDLSRAPLLHLRVAEDPASGVWYALLNLHHLVSDHVGLEIIGSEARRCLQGELEGLAPAMAYREFVAHALYQARTGDAEGFFQERLGDVDEPTLPFGLQDVRGDGSEIEEGLLQLDDGLCQSIRSQAKALQVSPAVLFHAAWGLVIGACSGRDDVVFGTVLSGRLQGTQGAERMLGMFINTLPLRLKLSGKSALELVRETELGLKELLNYEQVSLSVAQGCSGLDGDVPLFSGLLNYRHTAIAQGSNNKQESDKDKIHRRALRGRERTNYPFTMSVNDLGERFSLDGQIDRSVSVDRVLGYLECAIRELVEALEAGVGIPVSQIGVLSEAERHQQLVDWNDTAAEYPKDKCIHELFEEQVERHPGNTAVVFEEQQLTYLELNERSNQVAHYLRGQGVKPDTLVGLCVERSLEMVVGLLGILKAGGAYVPIDPAYPQERIRYMLEDSGVELILSQSILSDQLPVSSQQLVCLDTAFGAENNSAIFVQRPATPLSKNDLKLTSYNLAYVIYTSGSTGRPKGVSISQRSAVNYLHYVNRNYLCSEIAGSVVSSSLAFDATLTTLISPLLSGGYVEMLPEGGFESDLELLSSYLANSEQPLLFKLTPSHLSGLSSGQLLNKNGKAEHVIVVGGEQLGRELLQHLLEEKLPYCRFVNEYGPTEATVGCSAYWMNAELYKQESSTEVKSGSIPIGRPVSNAQLHVLSEDGLLIPMGAVGELHIGGAGLARGYLNNEKLTKEKFIPNPFSDDPDDRLYRTGDLARWLPDGNLEFLGRIDDQVKVRGFRIELGEIESQLSQHQWVDRCVVVAREGDGGDKQLVAYVVPDSNLVKKEDLPPDFQQSLRDHLQGMLPEYMVPSAYVVLDEIPLTPNGKVDKKALPAPDSGAYGQEEYVAPRTETERVLVGIWSELLGFEVDELSVRSNFFALGGHSLLVVKLIAQLQQAGLQVAVRSVFDSPTVEALASAIDGSSAIESYAVPPNKIPVDCEQITPEMLPLIELSSEEIETIVATVPGGAANVQDIYPLAPLQEGILFHHLLESGNDPYVVSSLMTFHSRKQLNHFMEGMQWVVDRHDVLRTSVLVEGLPHPVQVVWREAQLSLEEIAFEVDQDVFDQMQSLMQVSQSMDLSQAPLLRLRVAEDQTNPSSVWHVLMSFHHVIMDHMGWEIIDSEAGMYLQGKADQLPPPLPYREFVGHVLHQSRSLNVEEFFRERLGDVEEPTLPFGLSDVYGDGSEIKEGRLELDEGLCRATRVQAKRLEISPAVLFHAAWGLVIGACSGRDDVVFGTVLSGRLQGTQGAERMLGMFINTLPLRLQLSGKSALELVQETAIGLRELLSYEQVPLSVAQSYSGIDGDAPLFSGLLNYRHFMRPKSKKDGEKKREKDSREGEPSSLTPRVRERTNYPFTMSVNDLGEKFSLDGRAHHSVSVNRVLAYLESGVRGLVEALESAPEIDVSTLSLLSEAECYQQLVEWNGTVTDYPKGKCIHELFESQVDEHPTNTAVVFEGQVLTYAELNERSNQVAHYLHAQGVKSDTLVGLCVERSLEMVVGLLGILKAGGAYVPIDPQYPEERIGYMLKDSGVEIVLTQQHLLPNLSTSERSILVLEVASGECFCDSYSKDNLEAKALQLSPANLIYVIYTSGSTGRPKGVEVSHSAVADYCFSSLSKYYDKCIQGSLLITSFSFDATVPSIYLPLLTGGCIYLADIEVGLEKFWSKLIESDERLLVRITPSHVQALSAKAPARNSDVCHSFVIGGEVLPGFLIELLRNFFPNSRIVNHYGPTEAIVGSCSFDVGSDFTVEGNVPIGRPLGSSRLYILSQNQILMPAGSTGELYIGGVQLARGYLNNEELTKEKFIPNPFSDDPDDRLYRTGDLARWLPDGNLEFLGRIDDQVKVRGFRIELGEIESQLSQHQWVDRCVVVAREGDGGDKQLVAYVVPDSNLVKKEDLPPDFQQSLRDHLLKSLPEYMVPNAYVVLDEIPLTPNGKVDKKALPAPDSGAYGQEEYVAPRTETERVLVGIWSELLGFEADELSVHSNFFALGGHSLLAARLVNLINKRFGCSLPLRKILLKPTIESQAHLIHSPMLAEHSIHGNLVEVQKGQLPPLFLIHEAGGSAFSYLELVRELGKGRSIYIVVPDTRDEQFKASPSIEYLAAKYIKIIRLVQSSGPYRLLGWSIGGLIAYEIAYQLLGSNIEIEFLGLIDSSFPEDHSVEQYNTKVEERDDTKVELALLGNSILSNYGKWPEELDGKLSDYKDSLALLAECAEKHLLPEDFTLETIKQRAATTKLLSQAGAFYVPKPMPGPINLFVADDSKEEARVLSWPSLDKSAWVTHFVPGDHLSIMRTPRVSDLAKLITQELDASTGTARKIKPSTLMVPLQFGAEENLKIICVPGAGAAASSFLPFANLVGPKYSVFSFQALGLDGDQVPHSSVNAAAESYIEELLAASPTGPYGIVGHSFGGWVAFEIACRLQMSGAEVFPLVLLDSNPPSSPEDHVRWYSNVDALLLLIELQEEMIEKSLGFPTGELQFLNFEQQLEELNKCMQNAKLLPPKCPIDVVRSLLRVFTTQVNISYIPQSRLDGEIVLVSPKEMSNRIADAENERNRVAAAWRNYSLHLSEHIATGKHTTMLLEANVESIVHHVKNVWKQ